MSATGRGLERQSNDFYPTPDWLTRAILPFIDRWPEEHAPYQPKIYEPACGGGSIVTVLKERWPFAQIHASDINPSVGHMTLDFLKATPRPDYDIVITNPPYLLAQEFVEQGLKFLAPGGRLVLLLRVNFLGSQDRAEWMRAHTPAIYVTPRRPKFSKNKHGKIGSDATEYAWFVWGENVEPRVTILKTELPPSERRARRSKRVEDIKLPPLNLGV